MLSRILTGAGSISLPKEHARTPAVRVLRSAFLNLEKTGVNRVLVILWEHSESSLRGEPKCDLIGTCRVDGGSTVSPYSQGELKGELIGSLFEGYTD